MDAAIERAAVHERMQRRIALVEAAQRMGELGHSQLQCDLLAIARSITERPLDYCPEGQQEIDDDNE